MRHNEDASKEDEDGVVNDDGTNNEPDPITTTTNDDDNEGIADTNDANSGDDLFTGIISDTNTVISVIVITKWKYRCRCQ